MRFCTLVEDTDVEQKIVLMLFASVPERHNHKVLWGCIDHMLDNILPFEDTFKSRGKFL